MQHLRKPTLNDLICATALATLVTCSPGAVARDALALPIDFARAMRLKPVWVETHLQIRWRDEKPVVGAKVFDNGTGKLLGVTDGQGSLLLTVPNGTVLRAVDPSYGVQQALYLVQGTEKTAAQMAATTSTSNYINTAPLWWEYY